MNDATHCENETLRMPCGIFVVMAKRPGPSAKTRLAPALDPDARQALAAAFLRDKTEQLALLNEAFGVAVAPPDLPESVTPLLAAGAVLFAQEGADLGARLASVAKAAFAAGYPWVALVDGDTPTLPTAYLDETARALHAGKPLVLGPAWDGGYYLIALHRDVAFPRLFEDVAWSTDAVLATTLQRAAELKIQPYILPSWYDIDTPRELARLRHELAHRSPYERGYPAATARTLGFDPAAEATRSRIGAASPTTAWVEHCDPSGHLSWIIERLPLP